MFTKNNTSVLVTFKDQLPEKNQEWWHRIGTIIGPEELREKIKNPKTQFIDIEGLIEPGNIREASQLVDKLSRLIISNGKHLPKIITYHDYELWWVHYGDLMHKFCLPYTQYRYLLEYLKDFSKVRWFIYTKEKRFFRL